VLPEWVAQPAAPRPARARGGPRFVERSLRQSARLVADAVFAERAARRPGFLQSLDARAKLLSAVGLLVAASFLHHLPSLWALGLCVAAMAALSRVGIRVLFHRVWWLLPAAFVVIALPAMFSFITPGEPLITLYEAGHPIRVGPLRLPGDVTITRQGLAAAGLVVTRVGVGVLLAVTLTLTTRWQDLLKAVYTSATAPFVMILAMTYRYVFVLLRMVEGMHLGRLSRTISPGSRAEERRWVGGRVGALFSRSRHLSEQVYQAMVGRGYRGEPRVLTGSRFGLPEAAWLAACGLVAAGALLLDRAVLAGLPW